VPRGDLRSLSARVTREYAGRTDKTLTRDLNALREMGLVQRVDGGYVVNRDAVLAFLPARTSPEQ
jgi:DeoR/GlpR family transcriptional regulator of sugar metabolism